MLPWKYNNSPVKEGNIESITDRIEETKRLSDDWFAKKLPTPPSPPKDTDPIDTPSEK